MKKNDTQKGITLVALIITIIVLLILAVVAIRAVQGDGIISKAKSAQSKYTKAQAEEEIKLVLSEWKMLNSTQGKELGEFLEEKYSGAVEEPEDAEGGVKYIVILGEYEALIDKDGNLIEIEKAGPRPVVSDVKVVANSDGTGEALAEKSITDETQKLYITFTHTMSDGSGETTVSPSIPFEVTENGTYEFTITGTNGVTKIKKVTVNQFNVGVRIGSYVEYNVEYEDMYSGITYNKDNGWRYLGKDDDENYLIVSTAIPGIIYYDYDPSKQPTWWGTSTEMANASGVYYLKPSWSWSNGAAVSAAYGLRYKFESIPFSYNDGSTATLANKGTFRKVGSTTSGTDVKLNFRASGINVVEVHNLTLAEVNEVTNKLIGTTSFKKLTGRAKGLFDMQSLDNYTANFGYYLATPCRNDDTFSHTKIYYINNNNPSSTYGRDKTFGVRPVVTLSSDIQLADTNGDGVFEIK